MVVLKRVSNYGRVQSIGKAQNKRKVYLKPRADGYVMVNCSGLGARGVHIYVHVLFNDPKLTAWQPGMTVDHMLQNRSDNRASMLRWFTMKQQKANQKSDRKDGNKGKAVWCRSENLPWTRFASLREFARVSGLHFPYVRDVANRKRPERDSLEIVFDDPVEDHELPGERWAKVPESEGFVSSFGRVQPTPHLPRYTPVPKENGRSFVHIGKYGCCQVGSFMLRAFVRAPIDNETCDHIDRNFKNNTLENLKWSTKKEQAVNKEARPVYSTYRTYLVRPVGTVKWTEVDALTASRTFGLKSSQMSAVANPKTNRQTTKADDGIVYEVKCAPDPTSEDLPGEEWKDIVVEEWAEGGKYACVKNCGRNAQ